ncbi:MAG TPA: SDR family NAD(P)-dependent oxidoreductase [Hyphomicrobiaceae bacterium]|nr:SDR family NAD(P)-dependent oxidoreductase [Hyphomicrobiaceae bacterium]
MSEKRLAGRIALITGASRGIGRAVALALAREGAHVVILARTVGALEELDDEVRAGGGTATLVELDLTRGEKVDALGPSLYQRWDRLDILVGNAGVLGPISPLAHVTSDAWQSVLEVNLTANWRLIRTCDPLLRRSNAGRAIFVGSGAAAEAGAYWGPYATSKAGLETLVKTYAREIENTSVRANLVDPGPVRTTMRAKAFPGEDPHTLPTPEDVAPMFVDLALPSLTANGQVFHFRRRT